MDKIECFKIMLAEAKSELDFLEKRPILKINCSYKSAFGEPTTIVADPFLYVSNDTLFLFYENKKMYHKGVISMIKTTDLVHWTEPVTVLEEVCHLSYPWVFEEDGHIYMIPETCGLKEIRLYEANERLDNFSYVKTILSDKNDYSNGFSFSDTSIYKENGYYYLMTTVNDGKSNILKLYVSDRFDAGYKEHIKSPIANNNRYGRNAGSLFKFNNQLYRVAQDCEKRYGDNVNLLVIRDLTPTTYKEDIVRNNIIPTEVPFYKEGGHQFNMIKYKDKYIIATDAKEYHYFFLNRIIKKIRKFI